MGISPEFGSILYNIIFGIGFLFAIVQLVRYGYFAWINTEKLLEAVNRIREKQGDSIFTNNRFVKSPQTIIIQYRIATVIGLIMIITLTKSYYENFRVIFIYWLR